MRDRARILVVRTSPDLDIEPLLDTASKLFKESHIDVLKGSDEVHLACEQKFVNQYLYYDDGPGGHAGARLVAHP